MTDEVVAMSRADWDYLKWGASPECVAATRRDLRAMNEAKEEKARDARRLVLMRARCIKAFGGDDRRGTETR